MFQTSTPQTSVMVTQQQAANVTAAARAELSVCIQLLQEAIAQAQATGGNVVLSAQLLQTLQVRLQAAVRTLAAARVLQEQSANVQVAGTQVSAVQRQIIEALAAAQAQVNLALDAVQRLIAQAGGGAVAISLAAAQQILANIQAAVTSVAQIEAAQRQTIGVLAPIQTTAFGLPSFPFQIPTRIPTPFGTIGLPTGRPTRVITPFGAVRIPTRIPTPFGNISI